jgi:hypothetical protein
LGYNFCYISQSGDDDPQADFNQIKLKPKYESNYQKSPSIFFWLHTWSMHAKSGNFSSNFINRWLLKVSKSTWF